MTSVESLARRPQRADARRNYDRLIEAARKGFTANGTDTSLEAIARDAGVGIGTLYRHFPNRQALLEGVYLGEIQNLADSAVRLRDIPPWEALQQWLRGFLGYAVTKRAIAMELVATLGQESEFFQLCHTAIRESGGLLMQRAQEAGELRTDLEFRDVIRLVGGIAWAENLDPDQVDRMFTVILDGLRHRSSEAGNAAL
jgi:AcrR family transcriptional regulator